jgi:hypothetical protein
MLLPEFCARNKFFAQLVGKANSCSPRRFMAHGLSLNQLGSKETVVALIIVALGLFYVNPLA